MANSYFDILNAIDVKDKIEQKNGLNYLSWAWAWTELKKIHPDATYKIYETVNPQGYICNYFTDGKSCWVKTSVTIQGIEYIDELPVMDYKNRSIPLEMVTSFDVNKTIQRSITKAIGRHGLGLSIYAGEDLPEEKPQIETIEDARTLKLDFGKYNGKTLGEIEQNDMKYLKWLQENSKDEEVRSAVALITKIVVPKEEEQSARLLNIVKLNELLEQTNEDREKMYKHYGVESQDQMTDEQVLDAISTLSTKKGE